MKSRARTRQIVALDLGRATWKMAVLELKDSALRVRQLRLIERAGSNPAEIKDPQEALKSLIEGVALERAGQVVSVVDDSFACVRQVLTPRMPAGELPGAVQWELQRFLAIPPEEMLVDYELVGEAEPGKGLPHPKDTGPTGSKLRLVAAAIPAGTIREHLELLGRAGVRPTQLVPKAVAICAWAGRSRRGKGPLAILELGMSGSEFIVSDGGRPLFARKIPVGGADLTRAMTNVLMTAQGEVGLTEAEAEALKRGVGIPGEDAPEILSKGISRIQILSLIRGTLERLAVEVERSLTFFGDSGAEAGISELLLIGGGAHLKGLGPWLEERLGIRVTIPDPFDEIEVLPGVMPGSVVAPSLSLVPVLGAGSRSGAGPNLLPVELKEATRLRIQHAAALGAGTALVLSLSLSWVGLQVSLYSLSKQRDALRLEQATVLSMLPLARAVVNAQEQLAREPAWGEFFRRLSLGVPPEIYLTELNLDGRSVTLKGRIRRGAFSPDEALASFMQGLSKNLLAELQLRFSRSLEGPAVSAEFEVIGVLQGLSIGGAG